MSSMTEAATIAGLSTMCSPESWSCENLDEAFDEYLGKVSGLMYQRKNLTGIKILDHIRHHGACRRRPPLFPRA